jgi:hypothetical protein
MAKKVETIVTLTDDLDGSKADRTLAFGYDGGSYEIDLSKKNATAAAQGTGSLRGRGPEGARSSSPRQQQRRARIDRTPH